MKEITRPYIYEVGHKYTNLELNGVMSTMSDCLALICNTNRLSLQYLYKQVHDRNFAPAPKPIRGEEVE